MFRVLFVGADPVMDKSCAYCVQNYLVSDTILPLQITTMHMKLSSWDVIDV